MVYDDSNATVNSKFQIHGDGIYGELRKGNYVYPHQMKVIQKVRTYFSDNHQVRRPFLIEAPTGSGKTGMICLIPYALKCSKVLILSPSPAISEQIGRCFLPDEQSRKTNFFLKIGLIQPWQVLNVLEKPNIIKSSGDIKSMGMTNMVIVNAQKFGGNSEMTLLNNTHEVILNIKKLFEPFTTIIVDEAHHYPAPTWTAIVENFKRKQIIFLTATPINNEGIPIIPLNTDNNHISIPKDEIEGVFIRKSEFYMIPGLIHKIEHFTRENIVTIRTTIVDELKRHDAITPQPNKSHKALILVASKFEAELLARKFLEVYPDAAEFAKPYNSDLATRKNLIEFQEGELPALIVCGKLLEGYDNPEISICVIFRKVQSNLLFAQFVGRSLRMSSRKDRVTAKIFSAAQFNQAEKWGEYKNPASIAEVDPALE